MIDLGLKNGIWSLHCSTIVFEHKRTMSLSYCMVHCRTSSGLSELSGVTLHRICTDYMKLNVRNGKSQPGKSPGNEVG